MIIDRPWHGRCSYHGMENPHGPPPAAAPPGGGNLWNGPWDGLTIVTKAGAFGNDDASLRIVERLEAATDEAEKECRPGNRVAAETHVPCGRCFQCTTGLQHIYRDMKILGVYLDGAFAEYAVLPAVCAWKLDPAISSEIGATLEPFGIGVHALSKTKPAGKEVIVFGCGPIGIYAHMAARFSGAEVVIGVDVSGERLALARKMGTDIVLNPKEVNVQDEVDRITHGAGMDIVVELTGNRGVVNDDARTLRRGGEMVLVRLYSGPVEIDLVNNVIYKEATVYGVTGRIMWETWWTAQSMLLTGRMDISPVITHRFDLANYDQAFVLAESAASGKILFTM
jgi:threonine 3-dehydrogenase